MTNWQPSSYTVVKTLSGKPYQPNGEPYIKIVVDIGQILIDHYVPGEGLVSRHQWFTPRNRDLNKSIELANTLIEGEINKLSGMLIAKALGDGKEG